MTTPPAIRWSLSFVLIGWCVWLGSRFLELDTHLDPAITHSTLQAMAVSIGGMLAAIGGGRALWFKLNPDLLKDELAWMHCLVSGLLIWGLLGLALGSVGAISTGSCLGLGLLMSAGWLIKAPYPRPRLGPVEFSVLAFVLFFGLVDAVAPPIGTDELYYHLAIPQQVLESGTLPGGLLQPNGSRPLIMHLPFTSLLALGGDQAPRLFHLMLSGLLVIGVGAVGKKHLCQTTGVVAMLILLSCGSFVQEFGLASTNLPTALCVLAALDSGLSGRAKALALAAGAALSCKYTAGAPIAAIFLVSTLPWKARIWTGLAALALVAPWWVRNLWADLHPLFPFAGWPTPEDASTSAPMRFFFLEKYGAGRDIQAMLMLPWNAVMTSSFTSFRFLGRLNPVLLALFPLAMLGIRQIRLRSVVIAASLAFIGWAAGAHWIRHLLPSLPLLALACGGGLAWVLNHTARSRYAILFAVTLLGLSGLPSNLGPVVEQDADRIQVAVGAEPEDEYLRRAVDGYPAIEWANEHLPEDAKVALLFEWNGYLLQRERVLGSVEDHIPTRHFLLNHGEDSLSRLREMGVTHIVARRIRFLKKVYPFLEDEEFESGFTEPEELLEDLLLMESILVYESNRTRVYRLEAP